MRRTLSVFSQQRLKTPLQESVWYFEAFFIVFWTYQTTSYSSVKSLCDLLCRRNDLFADASNPLWVDAYISSFQPTIIHLLLSLFFPLAVTKLTQMKVKFNCFYNSFSLIPCHSINGWTSRSKINVIALIIDGNWIVW